MRSVLRSLAWLCSGALLIALAPGSAGAQTYVGGLSVSDVSPTPGSQVTVRAAGLQPNEQARVVIDDTPVATPTADGNGIAVEQVTIPATLPAGEHLLVVKQDHGDARPATYSRSIDVQTRGSAFSRHDGSSAPVLVGAALLAVLAGAWAVLRRRTRASG